jgi:hypothetical protein
MFANISPQGESPHIQPSRLFTMTDIRRQGESTTLSVSHTTFMIADPVPGSLLLSPRRILRVETPFSTELPVTPLGTCRPGHPIRPYPPAREPLDTSSRLAHLAHAPDPRTSDVPAKLASCPVPSRADQPGAHLQVDLLWDPRGGSCERGQCGLQGGIGQVDTESECGGCAWKGRGDGFGEGGFGTGRVGRSACPACEERGSQWFGQLQSGSTALRPTTSADGCRGLDMWTLVARWGHSRPCGEIRKRVGLILQVYVSDCPRPSALTHAVQEPTANTYIPPAIVSQKTNLPPPTRRAGSATQPAAVQQQQQPQQEEAVGRAEVIYDYEGAVCHPALSSGAWLTYAKDTGDLGVQTSQIVNIVEKTSADCE